MTVRRLVLASALLVVVSLAGVRAADVSGKWSATFNTDAGEQQYTYEFAVKGTELTGTAKGNLVGESKITDGKVDGDKISFVENANFQGMPFRIEYAGQLTSADEITLTRKVADIATEQLVAKRVK
ncbi:MAG TPA: hypothetical protein VI485_30095 [Vicinamibacterales bacterium]|nr:hypothetical protein [Vicinamibacterales bacterium]